MINKTPRKAEVKDAAQDLKDTIKKSKGEPNWKSEPIVNKKKNHGFRVFDIIDKKIKERIKKMFSRVKLNGSDFTEKFAAECDALGYELLYTGKPEFCKEFRSHPHTLVHYAKPNEIYILNDEGCKAYGIELPKAPKVEPKAPKKQTKPPVKPTDKKETKAATKKPGEKKPLVQTPAKLKSLLASKKK